MRRNLSGAFLVVALVFIATTLQAQSGRTRPAQNTKATNPSGQTAPAGQTGADSAADNPDDQPARNAIANGQGETVEGDVVRVDTALVSVPVSVMDRYGKYIPNLRRQDFHIFDEGVEQKIAYFGTVDQPFTVTLVIDTSGSTHFKLTEIQDAAIDFVNQLEPQDRVMVVSFDDQIRMLTAPTNNRDDLIRAIRRTRTGGGTRLYDAVEMVIEEKLQSISGRKAVVLFTDGVDTTSRHATYSKTVREAEESEGAIYTVDYDTSGDLPNGQGRFPGRRGGILWPRPGSGGVLGGPAPGSSPEDYRRANQYLHDLAEESGGRFFRGDTLQDISGAFAQVADELRRQYSIGFYPTPPGQPGQRRQIKVRVNRPDSVVKSRDSYIYSQKKT